MSNDEGYNGWTNYETWNVNLWITNDESSQRHWEREAQDCYDEAERDNKTWTREEEAAAELRDRLKAEVTDSAADMLEAAGQSCSMFADMLNGALSEVNWNEIAEHFIDGVDKEENEVSDAPGGDA